MQGLNSHIMTILFIYLFKHAAMHVSCKWRANNQEKYTVQKYN